MPRARRIPRELSKSVAASECSLHQLSPYIGKLKSSIARFLILKYTKIGDVVVDPFCGSGTIPLEATLNGRTSFGCDTSDYAALLSKAKLHPPASEKAALRKTSQLIEEAMALPNPDLRTVPRWVRDFFNPATLKDALRFAKVAKRQGNEFWFACFLGILHHQRPGFLSYPSSHLVPYLRNNKFPRIDHPDLYEYRPLAPRLEAKVKRVFKRMSPQLRKGVFVGASAESVAMPLAPTGSKMQALAAGLFKVCAPEIHVEYPTPESFFIDGYSTPEIAGIHQVSFFNFSAFMRELAESRGLIPTTLIE